MGTIVTEGKKRLTSDLVLFIVLISSVLSCRTNKSPIIQTAVGNYYLIKNPPQDKELLKKMIGNFVHQRMKQHKDMSYEYFYRYSSNTSYFIDHKPDPGGHSSFEFDNYDEDKIATFGLFKCEKDTTKQLGELRFFNQWGNYYQPDTLFNPCK
ncbi:hypothetical protein [Taibaiella koreensis]|uniref:hypothetical protein n=1 Tax=Taibaiella koreensis TaxID=1268548 RepID=UPI0013C357A7|nr:hypothetical protein [Taibaiella koreensis]